MQTQEKLERTIGYTFADANLLTSALTHRSHSSAKTERLEFLGDSILSLVIAEALYERFPEASEGQLSRLRARLVRRETLAELARDFTLGEYLIMGTGELRSGGFDRDSILSDTLEAIMGGVYIDSDFYIVRERILDWFDERLNAMSPDKSLKDPKSRLQELLQSRKANLPEYVVVDIQGRSHDQTFFVECRSEVLNVPAHGQGVSRRVAEQQAAADALSQLGIPHDHV